MIKEALYKQLGFVQDSLPVIGPLRSDNAENVYYEERPVSHIRKHVRDVRTMKVWLGGVTLRLCEA